MNKINITKETVNKAAAGLLAGITLGLVWKTLSAKARYYNQASKTMVKTNEYLDKTGKLIEDLND